MLITLPPNINPSDSSPPIGFGLIDVSSEDAQFSRPVRGISFATEGDIYVDTLSNQNVPIPSGYLAAKVQHGIKITKIYSEG